MPASEIAPLMDGCAGRLNSNTYKLRWAEGVADLLLDGAWAKKAFDRIAVSFADGAEKKRFELSRQMLAGYHFYGPGVQAH